MKAYKSLVWIGVFFACRSSAAPIELVVHDLNNVIANCYIVSSDPTLSPELRKAKDDEIKAQFGEENVVNSRFF